MGLTLIRAVTIGLSVVGTIIYLVALYGATWAACFGDGPLCAAGWWPRTEITAYYLIILGIGLAMVRSVVRSREADVARRRDGGI